MAEEYLGGKKKRVTRKGKGSRKSRETGGCDSCGATTGGKKTRSASSSRDPCATKKPKRKLSPYNIFIKSAYARLKKLHPNDTAPEIMKKAAIEWKAKK
jgi:hypothetical protein